jgi:hypothetical protein
MSGSVITHSLELKSALKASYRQRQDSSRDGNISNCKIFANFGHSLSQRFVADRMYHVDGTKVSL